MKMNYLPKNYYSIRPWFLCVIYLDYVLMLGGITFTDGLASNSNTNHTNNLGWINPESDVYIRRGRPLKIFCTISLDSEEVRNHDGDLIFQNDGKPMNATHVNETTISLHLHNENVSDSVYKCYLVSNKTKLPTFMSSITRKSPVDNVMEATINKSHLRSSDFNLPYTILIGHIRILVGEGPPEVQNLTCISHNWNKMSCSWVLPKDSPPVNHTIMYVPLNSTTANGSLCPFLNSISEYEQTCTWSNYTDPPYFHNYENLKITVTGVNNFDKTEQSFYFNKFKHVILDAPRDLRNLSQSKTIVELRWHKGDLRGIHLIPLGWLCDIEVISRFNIRHIHVRLVNSSSRHGDSVYYAANINKLRPNTEYTFRVRMKSPEAPRGDQYWSDYSNKMKCKTDPLTSPIFPKTDYSLFEISRSNESFRSINIFWKPVTDKDQYDGNLKYKIDLYNIDQTGKKALVESRVHNVISDDFTDSYIIGNLIHQFVITSAVSDGNAVNTSTNIINVPAAYNRVNSIALFYVIFYDYYNETGRLDWIWKPPKEQQNIVSYTPFWYMRAPNYFQMDWANITTDVIQNRISTGSSLYYLISKVSTMKSLPRCYVTVNTEYHSTGLVHLPIIHSVSHVWNTEWYAKRKSKFTEKYSPKVNSKRVAHIGWKISPNQLQKWFSQLHGTRL